MFPRRKPSCGGITETFLLPAPGWGPHTDPSAKSSYQFFSVRIVCDSCGRAMDITWLRSLLTKDWKLGWPRYPGSREKSGLEPGPRTLR